MLTKRQREILQQMTQEAEAVGLYEQPELAAMAACDCGGQWINGYRDGQHAPDRSGKHSRYCARHGGPEYLARLGRSKPG